MQALHRHHFLLIYSSKRSSTHEKSNTCSFLFSNRPIEWHYKLLFLSQGEMINNPVVVVEVYREDQDL